MTPGHDTAWTAVAAAQVYQRSRPSYPDAAVDWLLPPHARRALDLGAGTGQLTAQLVRRGLEVVAVEPAAGMRTELQRVLPQVPVVEGSAEEIPLPDGSVDLVLVAQAWHWVDVARAVPEVARVLAPAGRLGLLWNVRDEREDWVAELGRLLHRDSPQDLGSSDPQVGPPFTAQQRRDVAWTQRLSKPAVLDLVASRSYVVTRPPTERRALLAEVQDLLDRHPALAGRDEVDLPYVTQCSRADLPVAAAAPG